MLQAITTMVMYETEIVGPVSVRVRNGRISAAPGRMGHLVVLCAMARLTASKHTENPNRETYSWVLTC